MNTNKKLLIAAIVTMSGAFSTASHAVSATGQATGEVIAPLSIVFTTQTMDFGQFTAGTAAGSVTLNPTTNALTAPGGTGPTVVGATTGAAIDFSVVAAATAYTITASNAVLTDQATGLQTMNMTVDTSAFPCTTACSGNINNVKVGGALAVGISQAAGIYDTSTSGSPTPITITANYN